MFSAKSKNKNIIVAWYYLSGAAQTFAYYCKFSGFYSVRHHKPLNLKEFSYWCTFCSVSQGKLFRRFPLSLCFVWQQTVRVPDTVQLLQVAPDVLLQVRRSIEDLYNVYGKRNKLPKGQCALSLATLRPTLT